MSWTHEQGKKMIYKDINQTMTYWQRQKILIHSLDLFFCSPFLLHFSPSKLHISSQTQSTKTPFLSSFNLPSSGRHHLSCTPFFPSFSISHPPPLCLPFYILVANHQGLPWTGGACDGSRSMAKRDPNFFLQMCNKKFYIFLCLFKNGLKQFLILCLFLFKIKNDM